MNTPTPDPLPPVIAERIVEVVLAWDGKYPLVYWGESLDDAFRDPAVFETFLAMHAMIWGPSPELAKTVPPQPRPPVE